MPEILRCSTGAPRDRQRVIEILGSGLRMVYGGVNGVGFDGEYFVCLRHRNAVLELVATQAAGGHRRMLIYQCPNSGCTSKVSYDPLKGLSTDPNEFYKSFFRL